MDVEGGIIEGPQFGAVDGLVAQDVQRHLDQFGYFVLAWPEDNILLERLGLQARYHGRYHEPGGDGFDVVEHSERLDRGAG